jgi:plastocyanin
VYFSASSGFFPYFVHRKLTAFMKHMVFPALAFLLSLFIFSCERPHVGSNTGGGLLPTNYIVIKDSSFSPASLTVVSGSSITFLNQSSMVHRLMTDDSTTIRDTAIAPNKYYFFKKDTFGTFNYHLVDKQSARGTIIITP